MPRGVAVRQALAPRARQMRAEGLKYREIAERLNTAISTVHEWCADPDRSAHRARRMKYAGKCIECGAPTDGSRGPGRAPKRCQECVEWPEESIILAMQEWAAEHGSPPTSTEWRNASVDHPCTQSHVIRRIGWNELLLRAGLGLHTDRRPETQAELERLARTTNLSAREIGERLNLSGATVLYRLYYRGLTLGKLRA